MHRVHILHPKTLRDDALEAQASSCVKYASTCVFGCFKSESAFRFDSFRLAGVAAQIRKCLRIWFIQIAGLVAAKGKALSLLRLHAQSAYSSPENVA